MIWRKRIVALLIIAMLLSGTIEAYAWIGGKSKWVIGDIVYGNEFVIQKPSQTMFHQQTLASSDTEAMAISFPAATTVFDSAAIGETGVAIAQTSDEAVQATDTGYYKANWCFSLFSNSGGWDVGDVGALSPISSSSVMGSGLIWPYMTAPEAGTMPASINFKPYMNTSGGMSTTNITPNSSMISNTSASAPTTNASGTNGNAAWKSNPPLNYRTATKEEIQNASTMEKVWRNANLRNTVPQSYKGDVERPTWIYPSKDVLKMIDRNQVIRDSMNMTKQGANAHTLFWDL
jgi:hypothetical protein